MKKEMLVLLTALSILLSLCGLTVAAEESMFLAAPAMAASKKNYDQDSGGFEGASGGTSPTMKKYSSSSGPGAGLGLCADPLAAFMTTDMLKMTDTGPGSKVVSLILADQLSMPSSQSSVNSTLDMSGGTRSQKSTLNYDVQEEVAYNSGQVTEDKRGGPTPAVSGVTQFSSSQQSQQQFQW